MSRAMRWWVLAFLAAVVLAASAGALLWTRVPPPAAASIPPGPRIRCPDLDAPVLGLGAEPATTPLLLWGVGKVRLFLDGTAVFSPPEAPRRFAPGDHLLRAEAEGGDPLELAFRLAPFRPAMFHVEQTADLGLTLVWLGADCVSCSAAAGPVSLGFTRTSVGDEEQLREAAKALRKHDWPAAASRLRGVQPRARQAAAFRRLAAGVYQAAGLSALASNQLQPLLGNDLPAVLAAFGPLQRAEAAREKSQQLEQWNRLTEEFSRLLEKFALEAPGPVELATSRLAELSAGFLEATHRNDEHAQRQTVEAAGESLAQFIRTLRRSKPEDCEFQTRISAAALYTPRP